MSNSKFHFEGEMFKNNKGKIQIGETIYNHGEENIVINQAETLVKLEQLRKEVKKAENLDDSIRQDLFDIADSTESELNQLNPNPRFLSRINQRLQALQPTLAGWQAITSTVSAVCDLLPKG